MSRYLSVEQLDAIADRVLRAYRKLPEVRDGPMLRIVPDILLRTLLGLDMEYHHLSPDRIVLGATSYGETAIELYDEESDLYIFDGKTVLIETDLLADDQTGRRHFTIVHECCHHILKMLYPRDYAYGQSERRVMKYRDTGCRWSREEWQVDRLASMLLMPRDLVLQAMEIAGLSRRIEMLNAKWRKPEYEQFCECCEVLGVSKQALSIRMKDLGLLGESHLQNPNEILDIFREETEIV